MRDQAWIVSASPVMDSDDIGAALWESVMMYCPRVIYDSGTYQMWYSGSQDQPNNDFEIGYATSPDGVTWTRHGSNPVLSPQGAGWEKDSVEELFVLKVGATYHGWYSGDNAANVQIGHATSTDGITWVRDENNPVVANGGTYDSVWANKPHVIRMAADDWRMWYTGSNGSAVTLCYATSTDGLTWTKHPGNPILSDAPNYLIYPYVIYDGSKFELFLQRGPSGGPYNFDRAVSEDGITWSRLIHAVTHQPQGDPWNGWYVGNGCVIDGPAGREMYFATRNKADAETRGYHSIGRAELVSTYAGSGSSF